MDGTNEVLVAMRFNAGCSTTFVRSAHTGQMKTLDSSLALSQLPSAVLARLLEAGLLGGGRKPKQSAWNHSRQSSHSYMKVPSSRPRQIQ